MRTYLLDTSVIIDVLNGKRDRANLLQSLLRDGNNPACCAINIAETYACMRPHEAVPTEALLNTLYCYDIDREVAKRAGEIKFWGARKGKTLSLADTIIAAVVLRNDLTLITDNVKDYPVADLKILPLR